MWPTWRPVSRRHVPIGRARRFFGVAEAQTALSGLHRDAADEAFLAPLIAKTREAMGE